MSLKIVETKAPTKAYQRELISRCREEYGLTMRDLAIAIGISKSKLEYLYAGSRMENGKRVKASLSRSEQALLESLLENKAPR